MDRKAFLKTCGLGVCGCVASLVDPPEVLAATPDQVPDQRLAIGALRKGSLLVLTVEDDGLGATLPLPPGLGVGNTRERLGALYGDRAALSIDTAPDAGFRARIQIPLHEGRS